MCWLVLLSEADPSQPSNSTPHQGRESEPPLMGGPT